MNLRSALNTGVIVCIATFPACGAPQSNPKPQSAARVISIATAFPGASPLEVESEVTVLIEHAVNSLPGIDSIDSTSREGESIVSLQFAAGQDLDEAKDDVAKAVGSIAAHLPEGAQQPEIASIATGALPSIWLTLTAEESANVELHGLARRTRDRLLMIPGVDNVRVFGDDKQEFHIHCDPDKLAAYAISLDVCLKAIERQAMPTVDGLAALVLVMRNGVPVRLSDVALVRTGRSPPESLAWVSGERAVALGVFVSDATTARQSLNDIRKQLPQIRESLPSGVSLSLRAGETAASPEDLLVEFITPPRGMIRELPVLVGRATGRLRPFASGDVLAHWSRKDETVVRFLFSSERGQHRRGKESDPRYGISGSAFPHIASPAETSYLATAIRHRLRAIGARSKTTRQMVDWIGRRVVERRLSGRGRRGAGCHA